MLRNLLVVGFVLSFAVACSAQGRFPSLDSDQTWSMSFFFSYDGNKYTYQLDPQRLESSPTWDSAKADVPVSPTRAAAIAKQQLAKLIKIPYGWDVEAIEMVRAFEDRWYYNVKFGCVQGRCSSQTGPFHILVKMNGSPVEPKIKKEK